MNRAQKRIFIKHAKQKGISEEYAKVYLTMRDTSDDDVEGKILDGDKVMLDIKKIKSHKNYNKMLPKYKEFIEAAEGVVFTAKVEQKCFVSLEENPTWLFWIDDLIVQKG